MKKSEISYKKAGVEALRARHAGVLGLCAFVAAYPYDVPDFMPDILMMLGDHLHDPEPIPVSICKFYNCIQWTRPVKCKLCSIWL